MEKIVIIEHAGEYKEVVSKRNDGSNSTLKLREFEFHSGTDKFQGTMFGNLAEDNKATKYDGAPYVVSGTWQLREVKTDNGTTFKRNEFKITGLMPL